MKQLLNEICADVKKRFDETDTSNLVYHNFSHTLEVTEKTVKAAHVLGLDLWTIYWLEISAWFHDVGYLYTYHGHEDKGIEIANDFLIKADADPRGIKFLNSCISSTKMSEKPKNKAEALFKDIDLAYGVSGNFLERGQLLRKEWELCLGKFYSDKDWELLQFDFLSNLKFDSEYGQLNFAALVRKNLIYQTELIKGL